MPRRPQDDPDVDPPAGHRGDPDVAIVEQPHPCVDRCVGPRILQVVGEAHAPRQTCRADHAVGTGHDRARPVRPDDHPGVERRRAVRRPERERVPSDAGLDPLDGGPRPHGRAGAGCQVDERRIERRAIEAHGHRAAELGPVGQPHHGLPRRLEPHRGDRSGDACDHGRIEPRRPQRLDGRGRGEDTTGMPSPGRCAFQELDLDARPRESRGEGRPGGSGPDDRHVDPLVVHVTRAASAQRCPNGPRIRPTTSSPARSSRTASSSGVYARRTDSGPSCRV